MMATTDIQTNKNTNDGHNRYTDQQKHYNMMATTDIQTNKNTIYRPTKTLMMATTDIQTNKNTTI